MATHRIASEGEGRATTFCGLHGWRDGRRSSTEFDTAEGQRFEALETHHGDKRVDCKRCARAGDAPPPEHVTIRAYD